MNKKIMISLGIVIGIALIGAGIFAFTGSQNNIVEQETPTAEPVSSVVAEEMTTGDAPTDQSSLSANGSYITLTEYNSGTAKFVDTKKIYFFHASW